MKRFLQGLAIGTVFGAVVLGIWTPKPAAAQGTPPAPPEPAPERVNTEPRALAVRVTPEMVRYSNTRYALYFLGSVVNAAALLLLLRSRLSAKIRTLAERKGRNGLVRAYIYYPLFTLAYGALTLPLAFYSSFVLSHQYGLSNQKLGDWVLDGAKGYALSAVLGPPVIALLYWTLRRSPRRWWLGFWLASLPLIAASVLLAPLVIEPLFNKFQPLQNQQLRQRILALAAKAGIERSRVFEVDASRRTKAVNAYVTGIGGSARIVLWDTLLQRLDEDEVLSVMAHEMGHYVEHHVPLGVGIGAVGSLALFLLIHLGGHQLLARNGDRWGIRGMDDLASLPALLLLLLLLNFFGSPVESAISRTFETRADQFALRMTGDGRAAASAFIKLSEKNLSQPNPPAFVVFWMFSHPPLQERIDRALNWPRQRALPAGESARPARPDGSHN